MKKYFSCHNNGVTAIVSEEVYNDIQKQNKLWQLFADREAEKPYNERTLAATASSALKHLCFPTFTFTRPERFKDSPWFTGDMYFMNELYKFIEESGGGFDAQGFYVPFSNGCEHGLHGKDAMKSELAYVTTEQQFQETFGISVSEIRERARVSLGQALRTEEVIRQAANCGASWDNPNLEVSTK